MAQLSLPLEVKSWSTAEVSSWLETAGFAVYVELFRDQNVDGEVLLMLSEKDLKSPPLKIHKIGDIKKLFFFLNQLKVNQARKKYSLDHSSSSEEFEDNKKKRKMRLLQVPSEFSFAYAPPLSLPPPYQYTSRVTSQKFSSVAWQVQNALLSTLYLIMSVFCTAVTMTFVHERVPDQQHYRPLPDIFLDNIRYIDWAFKLTEVIGLFLLFIFVLVFLFHRHRLIMLWRCNIVLGTILLLRCVTMMLTSLSVPGDHIKCSAKDIGSTLEEKLKHAWYIASGVGMSLNGITTCGDYMFSAHTVVITLLNFAIIEYTPEHWKGLHVLTWVLNIFGMFFVLASHEHYSIDVFVAFYITHRLFLYYHSLANSNALQSVDKHRMYSFFPLFSFFEEGTEGKVPQEFEWPWKPLISSFRKRKISTGSVPLEKSSSGMIAHEH